MSREVPLPPRIGVDVGGTTVVVALIAPDGRVVHQHAGPVRRGNDAMVASIVEAVSQLRDERGDPLNDLAGRAGVGGLAIGVATPGRVVDGVVTHALNLGIERLDLADELEKAWGVRPRVENDVNAAAIGAWTLESDGAWSVAYFNVGTGMGAGLVLGGRLWRGSRGGAGEVGHVRLPGVTGDRFAILEDVASGRGITQRMHHTDVHAGVSPIASDANAADLLATASDNEQAAQLLDDAAQGIADAVRTLVLTVDVERVFIGGGLTRVGTSLRAAVTRHLEAAGQEPTGFLAAVDLPGRVRWLDPDEPVGAIGAAVLSTDPDMDS